MMSCKAKSKVIKIKDGKKDMFSDNIYTYKQVRKKTIRAFPPRFWSTDRDEKAKEIFKYMIETELKWSKKDICNKLNHKTFAEHNLSGMLKLYDNTHAIVKLVYPDIEYFDLEFRKQNYTNDDFRRKYIRWVITKEMNITKTDKIKALTKDELRNNGLSFILRKYYKGDVESMLMDTFPRRYKIK